MMYRKMSAMLLVSAICGGAVGEAVEYSTDLTIENITFGTHICGPELTTEDLEGRVVLLVMWNIGCPKVTGWMPIAARMYERYKSQGFIVIGQNSESINELNDYIRGKKYPFTIQWGGNVKMPDNAKFYIPHAMIFDATGKCVYRKCTYYTYTRDLQAALEKTLESAPPPAFANVEFEKLQPLSDELKKVVAPCKVYPQAVKLAASEDEAIAAEAKAAVQALDDYGTRQLKLASQKKEQRPQEYLDALAVIMRDFRGMEAEKAARDTVAALRDDEKFVAEMTARQVLEKIKQFESNLRPIRTRDGKDTSSEEFRKANAKVLSTITSGINAMRSKFPDTHATADAVEWGEGFGLTFLPAGE